MKVYILEIPVSPTETERYLIAFLETVSAAVENELTISKQSRGAYRLHCTLRSGLE